MRFGHGVIQDRAFLGAKGRLKHKSQVGDNPLRGGVESGDRGENSLYLQLPEGIVEDVPQELSGEEVARGGEGEVGDRDLAVEALEPGCGEHFPGGRGIRDERPTGGSSAKRGGDPGRDKLCLCGNPPHDYSTPPTSKT